MTLLADLKERYAALYRESERAFYRLGRASYRDDQESMKRFKDDCRSRSKELADLADVIAILEIEKDECNQEAQQI